MRKIMKSILTIVGPAVLMLALTQCASVQEIEAPLRARASFEVYATPAETKTVNDGLSTLWEQGDGLSLFHAPAGTPTFTSDGLFTVDEPSTGHANGALFGDLQETGSYDWYMVYPYAESASRPTEVSVVVGAPFGEMQVQRGKDSRAHLAGENFPVGGRASGVPGTQTPVLTSAPLISVVAVNVTNPGQGVARITTLRFKAPEMITGAFWVDVTGSAPVFTADEASDEAVLSVEGVATLRAGESAIFYLGIKPFQASAGSTLTLTVNDQVRSVTLSRDVTFSAGKIKTLNVTLDESEPGPQYYFKRVTTVTPGRKYLLVAEDTKQGGLRMACPLPEGTDSGRLPVETVEETEEGIITQDVLDNAFTFSLSDEEYTIRQQDGRYLYNNNKDDVYAGTEPNAGFYWAITFDPAEEYASILNRSRLLQYNPTTSVQKFQTRQSSSTVGRNPWLYELQNDEEATGEFLRKTVPGVYDYKGISWLYADGTSQSSVRTLSGTVVFRIFYPAEFTVVQVSGIPAAPALNDRFSVRMVRYVKQAATHADDFSVTVVKVEDGKAWLLGDGGTGFLVNIQ